MANGHGGARKGAGRKQADIGAERKARILAAASRTNLIPDIDPVIAALEPLDIMIIAQQVLAQDGLWHEAALMAEKTAPYMHSRRAAIEVTHEVRETAREYTLEELEAQLIVEEAQLIDFDTTQE